MPIKIGITAVLVIGMVFFFWPGYPPNQFLQSLISGKSFPQQAPVNQTNKKDLASHQMPELLNIEIKSDVDKEDAGKMQEGFKIMDFYLNRWFGKSITKKSAIRVEAKSGDSKFQKEGDAILFLYLTQSSDWQIPKEIGAKYNTDMRSKLAAHEYVHLYQINNGCANLGRDGEKIKWFLEGEAEWLSYKVMEETGNLPFSFDAKKMIMMQLKTGGGNFNQLNSYEQVKGASTDTSLYGYFALAIDYLVKDKNIKTLDDFCINLGKGQGVSVAFQNAFSILLEKFYSDFEAYYKNLAK